MPVSASKRGPKCWNTSVRLAAAATVSSGFGCGRSGRQPVRVASASNRANRVMCHCHSRTTVPRVADAPGLVGSRYRIFSTAVRRQEWRRGTQKCVRYARGANTRVCRVRTPAKAWDFDAKVLSPDSPLAPKRVWLPLLTVEHSHLTFVIARSRDGGRGNTFFDVHQFGLSELHAQCSERFGKLRSRPGADHWNDTPPFGQHPGDGQLRGFDTGFRGELLQPVNDFLILLSVLAGEPR